MTRLTTLLLILLPLTGLSQTTIFLVRHAEKVDNSTNPALSIDGRARAIRLKEMLGSAGIDKIYSTEYLRTINTVKPLADQLRLEIESYRAFDDELVTVLRNAKNQQILVSGHSNTIPDLTNKLIGENRYTQLPDNEYSTIYVVTITEESSDCLVLKY